MSRLEVDKIAIIGAGPGGLAAAKYLLAEKKFSKIDIFEQRSRPGGVWNYTSNSTLGVDFTIPRTRPREDVEEPIAGDGSADAIFASPVYDLLETNIPHTLMNYTDKPFPRGTSLFPPHRVVLSYLEEYAEELRPHLSLNTQVVEVSPAAVGGSEKWSVTTRSVISKEETTAMYDAVICGNGHYSDPFLPSISGLKEFSDAHPGVISHSKYFKRPQEYKNKRVIVVGHSASGIDISTQIGTVSNGPVLVSEKVVPTSCIATAGENKESVPEIVEFLPATRGVRFVDGRVEDSIDSVIFCTGYQYSFPFLKGLESPVVTTGERTENVYEHVLYHPRPTLAFLALPQRIVPMPVSEAQSGWIARVFSGRLSLPSKEAMREWEADTVATMGGDKNFHNLAGLRDLAYINRLYEQSMSAAPNPALENGGEGKIPPYWDEKKKWLRERFPLIKIASRKLGSRRHEVQTLEELGFDFQKWKAENAVGLGAVDEKKKPTVTETEVDATDTVTSQGAPMMASVVAA